MLDYNIDQIDKLLGGDQPPELLTTESRNKILRLAARGDLQGLKDLLEGRCLSVTIQTFDKLVRLKKGLLETQLKMESQQALGLKAEQFGKFLELLMNDLHREQIEIPDCWKDQTYWLKLLRSSENG